MTITSAVNAGAAPQSDSVDAFFAVVGRELESASDLTVADVRAALSAGAPLRASGERDTTPLMYVAGYNPDPDVTRTLLGAGAEVSVRDTHGWTALMFAAAFNSNPAVVQSLLDAGAETAESREYEAMPYRYVTGYSDILGFMPTLIETGDVDSPIRGGDAALMAAASFNLNPETVRVLTDAGAAVNGPISGGGTALMSAAGLNPNPAVTQALIDAGADPHARTEAGETALMIAASHNDRDVLQLLLDHGIEIDARDREGWSALMAAAAFNQDPQVGRLLLAAGAETKPGGSVGTRALIMPGWPEEITAAGEAIGEAGIAAFELTPGGEPAVLAAALYGQNLDVLQALIDAGADILGAHTTDGWTAAMAAAFNPNPDVMQFLIDAGADIHARTRQGWTAVRYADRFNPNSLVAQTLLDAGARLEPGAEPVQTAATPEMTCAGSVAVGEAPNSAGLISDCEALLRASDALDGGAGVLNWDLDRRIGDWMGVSLRADRVISLRGLYLHHNRLTGSIPSTLANLTDLTSLWLSDNRLTGDIPPISWHVAPSGQPVAPRQSVDRQHPARIG